MGAFMGFVDGFRIGDEEEKREVVDLMCIIVHT